MRRTTVIGLGAGSLALLASVLVGGCRGADELRPHPSDSEMIAVFSAHRAQFYRLHEMTLQDKGLLRVDSRSTWPEDPASGGISASRAEEYRSLMRALGIRSGLSLSRDRLVLELAASTQGFVTRGSEKGYLYSAKPVCQIVASGLDAMSREGVGSGCIRLEHEWYLYFEGN